LSEKLRLVIEKMRKNNNKKRANRKKKKMNIGKMRAIKICKKKKKEKFLFFKFAKN